jgi:hydrogenase nickel insertion protein HypA
VETFRCQYECGPNVEVLDLGTPGLDLAPYLYGRNLIVIIVAVHANVPPGTLSVFCEHDFVSSRASLRITGHDPGLWDTLTHLRLADSGPAELIVMGVAPGFCRFGEGISDSMLNLASEAAGSIAQLLVRRRVICVRRHAAAQPDLWWLPLPPLKTIKMRMPTPMDETSIIESILDVAEEKARGANSPSIQVIKLRIGQFTAVAREALDFALEVTRQGTLEEHARLDLEVVPTVLHCVVRDAKTQPTIAMSLICMQCGFPLKIVSGKELQIEYIEIEEHVESHP